MGNPPKRNSSRGSRPLVGELTPSENPDLKKEVAGDFVFENKWEKPEDSSARTGYNKANSFFDDISCDALNRSKSIEQDTVRLNRDKQRQVDKETFGVTALKRPFGRRGGKGRGGKR